MLVLDVSHVAASRPPILRIASAGSASDEPGRLGAAGGGRPRAMSRRHGAAGGGIFLFWIRNLSTCQPVSLYLAALHWVPVRQ